MRDIDQIIKPLEDMADDPGGMILIRKYIGMSPEERTRVHSVELLTDAGLALRVSDGSFPITNAGYDFLNAVRQDRPRYMPRLRSFLAKGNPYLRSSGASFRLLTV